MLINLTNHPSGQWGHEQLAAAGKYGSILDMPFPNVPPEYSEEEVARIAEMYEKKILRLKPDAVLCQGEICLAFAIAEKIRKHHIPVLAACSERITEETTKADGSTIKVSRFVFHQFRKYA